MKKSQDLSCLLRGKQHHPHWRDARDVKNLTNLLMVWRRLSTLSEQNPILQLVLMMPMLPLLKILLLEVSTYLFFVKSFARNFSWNWFHEKNNYLKVICWTSFIETDERITKLTAVLMDIDTDVRSLYNNVFGEMDDNVEREKLYNELIELKVYF